MSNFVINPYRHAVAVTCDLYDLDEVGATVNADVDHDLDGFKSKITGTLGSVKMWLYRVGTPNNVLINLYNYTNTSLTATYAPTDNVKYTDLTTDTAGQEVSWTIPSVSFTTNTRLVIPYSGSGGNNAFIKGKSYDATLDFQVTKSQDGGVSFIDTTGHSNCGCITAA